MNKWYQPFGLLLLAAVAGNLGGCTTTSGWLAKKPVKKSGDEKLASADKKSSSKSRKSKSSKVIADAKSAKSKDAKPDSKDVNTATASKTKPMDVEHEKYAASERVKKAKPAVDTAVAKADPAAVKKDTKLVADTKSGKLAKANPKTEEDLDAFLTQTETPLETPKKAAVKKAAVVAGDPADEEDLPAKKDVIQVKKETAKDEDEDVAEWANVKTQRTPKTEKTADTGDVAESFEDELQSPIVAKSKHKSHEIKVASTVEGLDDPATSDEDTRPTRSTAGTTRKGTSKKQVEHGLPDLCPDADGELCELLKSMHSDDTESLKQGLHRIGQMRTDGVAAAPVLRKMLKHEDAFVRVHAALAMARLNMTSAESIAVVTDSLKSRNASLRSFGTSVLSEMGPKEADVLESLAESLNDRNGQTRVCVAEVLIRHEDWSLQALQCLLACLKDKDENVRWIATYSLAELGPESPEVVQGLLKAAHDPVSKVRTGAVYALGQIGPYAKRTSGDLRKLLESTKDDELKSAINDTLQKINKDAT